MPRKRRLESNGSSSKKRQRMNDDDDEEDATMEDPNLLLARQSLRDIERENLETRVAKLETTIHKGVQSVRQDMIRAQQRRVAEVIQGILRQRISFPVDYDVSMKFIEKYTGVKRRGAAAVAWDDKVSRSWLNRQRAKVYAPTLFKEFLDFIATVAHQVAQSDSANAEWLRRAVKRKLVTEILSATYKPVSKQAAAKKLICANAVKESAFTEHLCTVLDWQQLADETTLEQISQHAENEYDEMMAGGYGVWKEKSEPKPRANRRVDEDAELDLSRWSTVVNGSNSTSHTGSPPSPISPPMKRPGGDKLFPPPNFSASDLHIAMNNTAGTSAVSAVVVPSRLPIGPFGGVPVDDGIAESYGSDQLGMLDHEQLVRRCRDLEANNCCLRDQLKMYQQQLSKMYKDARERHRVAFSNGGGGNVGQVNRVSNGFGLPSLPLNLNFVQQAAVIPYVQQPNPYLPQYLGEQLTFPVVESLSAPTSTWRG